MTHAGLTSTLRAVPARLMMSEGSTCCPHFLTRARVRKSERMFDSDKFVAFRLRMRGMLQHVARCLDNFAAPV